MVVWYNKGCSVYFVVFGIFCGLWYILWSFDIFCGRLVYFVVVWYILWSFGKFSPFWSVVPRKIWHRAGKMKEEQDA
jgi:hypothetical protein